MDDDTKHESDQETLDNFKERLDYETKISDKNKSATEEYNQKLTEAINHEKYGLNTAISLIAKGTNPGLYGYSTTREGYINDRRQVLKNLAFKNCAQIMEEIPFINEVMAKLNGSTFLQSATIYFDEWRKKVHKEYGQVDHYFIAMSVYGFKTESGKNETYRDEIIPGIDAYCLLLNDLASSTDAHRDSINDCKEHLKALFNPEYKSKDVQLDLYRGHKSSANKQKIIIDKILKEIDALNKHPDNKMFQALEQKRAYYENKVSGKTQELHTQETEKLRKYILLAVAKIDVSSGAESNAQNALEYLADNIEHVASKIEANTDTGEKIHPVQLLLGCVQEIIDGQPKTSAAYQKKPLSLANNLSELLKEEDVKFLFDEEAGVKYDLAECKTYYKTHADDISSLLSKDAAPKKT